MVHSCPGKCHHELMDLNPVTRTSAVEAVILNVLYCLLVLALLLWVFHWGRVSIMVVALLLLAVIIISGFFALRPQTERGEDYIITSCGARSQGQLTVPVPVSELPRLVERACAQHAKLGLRELDVQGGRISVGITFSSWGARPIRLATRLGDRVADRGDLASSDAAGTVGSGPERRKPVPAVPRRGTGGRAHAHERDLSTARPGAVHAP